MGDYPLRIGNGQPVDSVDRWETVCVCFKLNHYFCPVFAKSKKSATDVLKKMPMFNTAKHVCRKRPDTSSKHWLTQSLVNHMSSAVSYPLNGCDLFTTCPIFTENAVGSCERNICECDKAFAAKLPAAAGDPEDGWSEAHHAHYGGFDSRNQCMRKLTPGGNDKELVCCGEYPDR